MILLIIPFALNFAVTAAGVLALVGLVVLFYVLIVRPAMLIRADREAPPPEEGSVREIIVDPSLRALKLSIGQIDSDLKTRMNGIREDHIVFRFTKDRELEDYEIQINATGAAQIRVPHSKKMENFVGMERLHSSELIGDSAGFRLVASAREGRVNQYVEFELTAKYFITRAGDERMKFLLTLKKIFPSLDKNSRNKKGIYTFGRVKLGQQVEE